MTTPAHATAGTHAAAAHEPHARTPAPAQPSPGAAAPDGIAISARSFDAWYGEFHALKGHMGKSKARYEAHGGRPGKSDKGRSDMDVRQGDAPGNSGDKGKGNSGDKGKPADAGPGKSDKGKGNGKGKP